MEDRKKLKLFISYSHLDERHYIDQFRKHIAPLKDNDLLEDWYDRKILAGDGYQNKIDNNLDDADIICLFISANFLSSDSCKLEKKKALELKKNKGTVVIPIILSHCGWLDDKEISKLLALPEDGNPITSFQNQNEAWHNIYNGLKKIILKEIKIRQLKISKEFESFLQDTEMLTKAHSNKERVLLNDIFIYSELNKYDNLREYKDTISSEVLLNKLLDYPKIAIAGEEQSGKTSLCKIIFKNLLQKKFVPVYVSDKKINFAGKMENRISRAFNEQYINSNMNEIDIERIIPIVDDFHFAKDKEKHINDLNKYSHCIVVVDDIFGLNIVDEKLIGSFSYFKIKELKPSLRYGLIKKWVSLADKGIGTIKNENSFYHDIDNTSELIDSTLGKTIGRGIMPSYPFFILSTIVTYETFAMPLNQEITSQGYCYQAFIYFYLRKQGVKNDEIDIYVNFLSEIAFYFYNERKDELSTEDFSTFMKLYLDKYNLPIKQELLLKNLRGVILNDSFNNFSFKYRYLYYFFVAKYLAEHLDESKVNELIVKIVNNLHLSENAYITVFIAHHSKNVKILDEIELNALCLFDQYTPATLTRDEVKFFDKQADIIIKAALPPNKMTPEKIRSEKLKLQDELEQSQENIDEKEEEKNNKHLGIELRRAVKTVEVMGSIIKNRSGSLERTKLEEFYKEAMNVHLRILSSFFEIIMIEDKQKIIIDYLSDSLEQIIEEKKRKPSREQMEEISRIIFWNLNFFVVFGVIGKIVHSLGSDKLTEIIKKVCDEVNTPASFLVRQGILMWYNKNIEISEIEDKLKMREFSEIAKRVMELIVINHYSMHSFTYKDKQRIENILGIPSKKLLTKGYKKSR